MAVLPDVFKESVPTGNCLWERICAKAKPYASGLEARMIDIEMDRPEVSVAIEVVCWITLIGPY